jgi:hypothetical protein
MSLCKHKHIFGKEGEGAHSIRLFNVAIVDVAATVVAGALIARLAGLGAQGFFLVLVGLFVLGVIAHRVFCVNTTVNKAIFGVV